MIASERVISRQMHQIQDATSVKKKQMHNKTKTIWLIFLTLLCISNLKAQTQAKDIVLNLGAYSGYGHHQGEPFTENSGIPALSAGAEYFVNKYFAIGSYVTYTYVFDKFVGNT